VSKYKRLFGCVIGLEHKLGQSCQWNSVVHNIIPTRAKSTKHYKKYDYSVI
jgi:hypothetical protein